ncbi:MAG: DMT family transporter [Aureliella sp.]
MNAPSKSAETESGSAPLWIRFYADFILLSTAVLWGINIIVFKYAIVDLSPWLFNGIRLVFATIALGLLVWLESRFAKARDSGNEREKLRLSYLRLASFCLLSGVAYMLMFVRGIELTTAGNTALLLASMPMWTAVLSFLFLSERLGIATWGGLAVTFVGTILVTTQSSGPVDIGGEYLSGNLYVLAAAIAWAAGTVMSKSLLESMTPLQLAFVCSLTTTPLHLAISAIALVGDPAALAQLLEPKIIIALVYSGVFSTGVAYATWYAGVRIVGGSHAAVYQNFVTVVAVAGGWLFLREQITAPQIIGGCLTVAGLLVMRRSRMISERRQKQLQQGGLAPRGAECSQTLADADRNSRLASHET